MTDQLTPYPAYRDSGVPWLDMIPTHWEVKPLKHWVKINARTLAETTPPNYQFHYLDIGAVTTGFLIEQPQRLLFADAPSRARRIVQQGDTLVSTVRTYLKAVYYVGEDAQNLIASTGFAVLSPKQGVHPKYLSYLVQSDPFTNRVSADSVGIAYPAIAETKVGAFHIAMPTLEEQAAIVRYLDHADRRIRRFIAAKRKLIALLNEQKQIAIHDALLHGLDSTVRLKSSGAEWLCDVPEHWAVVRCGSILREVVATGFSERELLSIDRYRGVIKQTDIGRKTRASEDRSTYKRVRPGELAYNLMNAFVGSIGISEFDGIVSPAYAVARFVREVHPMYYHHLFRTSLYMAEFNRNSYGIMDERNRLYFDRFKAIFTLLPPLEEQFEIVNFINYETEQIEVTTNKAKREIDLIREYRTRLIADVVTGKLDVRAAAAILPDEHDAFDLIDTADALAEGDLIDEMDEAATMVEDDG